MFDTDEEKVNVWWDIFVNKQNETQCLNEYTEDTNADSQPQSQIYTYNSIMYNKICLNDTRHWYNPTGAAYTQM